MGGLLSPRNAHGTPHATGLVGDGGRRGIYPPPRPQKNREIFFSDKFHAKFGKFLANIIQFCYFSSKYVKFGHFVNFSYTYFRANMSPPS